MIVPSEIELSCEVQDSISEGFIKMIEHLYYLPHASAINLVLSDYCLQSHLQDWFFRLFPGIFYKGHWRDVANFGDNQYYHGYGRFMVHILLFGEHSNHFDTFLQRVIVGNASNEGDVLIRRPINNSGF